MTRHEISTLAAGLVWFVLWTGFSFYAHLFARKTIQNGGLHQSFVDRWLTVTILTCVQTIIGGVVLRLLAILIAKGYCSQLIDSSSGNTSNQESNNPIDPCKPSLYLGHAIGTLATNASIAFVNTGSAFTIKAFEPITTAVLTCMLLGTKLETHVIIALPLVISGALGFICQPSEGNQALFGLGMAFVSNIIFGVRNINLKLFHSNYKTIVEKLQLLQVTSFAASLTLIPVILVLFTTSGFKTDFLIYTSVISGMFHIAYTIISTCIILKYTSTVGHATCNLLKRILVAAVFYFTGTQAITASNWIMAIVLLAGLAVYLFPWMIPLKGSNGSLSLIAVICAVVLLVACAPQTSTSNSSNFGDLNDNAGFQLPPIGISDVLNQRQNEHQQHQLQSDKPVISYKNPKLANQRSIKITTINDLISEAYRLHSEVFIHIMGKYKRAVLVNVFEWFNKGDHLITIGQRKILQRLKIDLIYHCYYPGQHCTFENIPTNDPELVVLVQGAGYIGHPAHEFVIERTLSHFPNNRIMVFPISVCHPTPPCTEIIQFSDIFRKHKDVHVVLRDRYSYDLAQQYFNSTYNYLAPDSAFAVGSIRMNIVPVYDIIWLKRDDWESQSDPMPEFPKDKTIQVTDWDDGWMDQKSDDFWENHQLKTMTGIAFLARAKVVVSDRLHAHIMSQLMGKLNVVINSQTKKQEHYYKTWEQSIKTSVLVNDNKEALAAALNLLKMYDETVTLV